MISHDKFTRIKSGEIPDQVGDDVIAASIVMPDPIGHPRHLLLLQRLGGIRPGSAERLPEDGKQGSADRQCHCNCCRERI